MEYKINDIVQLQKNHPCSITSKNWKIIELGAEVKLKCCNCGHIISMKRYDFDTRLVCVVKEGQ